MFIFVGQMFSIVDEDVGNWIAVWNSVAFTRMKWNDAVRIQLNRNGIALLMDNGAKMADNLIWRSVNFTGIAMTLNLGFNIQLNSMIDSLSFELRMKLQNSILCFQQVKGSSRNLDGIESSINETEWNKRNFGGSVSWLMNSGAVMADALFWKVAYHRHHQLWKYVRS